MKEQVAVQFKLKIPTSLKAWIDAEAKKNASSRGSEIVRAIRERKERCEQKQAA